MTPSDFAAAHGLYYDPEDLMTYANKVNINGIPVNDKLWRSRFLIAVNKANEATVVRTVNCDIVGRKTNYVWYNEMNLEIAKKKLGVK